ncbi:MAG: 4-hydroxy-tetrahydrodipicolinate reductase [Bacteroidota bacterium]
MRIALLGYGRMGKAIEKIAIERGHSIKLKVDAKTEHLDLKDCDVAIDFSLPQSAFDNISKCLKNSTPVISGTTGWLDKYNDVVKLAQETDGTFLYASNFSLGVNIFFELNSRLAKFMAPLPQYTAGIEEIHHTQKLDAPSGTAITLAEAIIKESNYKNWTLKTPTEQEICISAKRIENVPGTHDVSYRSEIDTIEIRHTAHSRQGFALGAVIAAEYIHNKKGVFTMKDVLNIS